MSVSSHLNQLARDLNVAENESERIRTSTETLSSRVGSYFGSEVLSRFRFGSTIRYTMLPRRADSYSDVDFMVVFDNSLGYTPQTYLNKLKRFAEARYSSSEIRQSSPTIVLELNHIIFELVPAYRQYSSYYIPAPQDRLNRWLVTDPLDFRDELNRINEANGSRVKPAIRLVKYWNARNGYIYSTFGLEQSVARYGYYGIATLRETFYQAVRSLNMWDLGATNRDRVQRFKDKVAEIERDEDDAPTWAENTIKGLLPPI